MKKYLLVLGLSLITSLILTSCGNSGGGSAEIEKTDIVPSGIYKGVAKEVDAEEKEIYVETPDGKILELYLKETTTLSKNGQSAVFGDLKQGGQVEVTVEKVGNKLDPKSVTILEEMK